MTSSTAPTVLVVGSTGSIGRLTVAEALTRGYRVRALVRDAERASHIVPAGAELTTGDVTRPETLRAAVDGADAVIFTHGVETTEQAIEEVSYAGVRDLLQLLAGRDVRIVLMSAVGVTARSGLYNTSQLAEWKRRAERLVRFSGQPYTIVRPGWFDENGADEHQLVLRQGDRHHAGDPSDGAVSREQIAQVLVAALSSPEAAGRTFELVAEQGPATEDLEPLFAALPADPSDGLDGPGDARDMPLDEEPQRVRDDLRALRARA